MEEGKKKIFEEFENKRKEISELKSVLNRLNDQKEKFFQEKEKASNEIKILIRQVKEFKEKRDRLTSQVKAQKSSKSELDAQISSKIEEAKKIRAELEALKKKYRLEGDPSQIRREIARLERIIEREAISFDKEEKLMKRIKELKRKLEDFSVINDEWKRLKVVNDEIDHLKAERESAYGKVQEFAKKSQSEHEHLIEINNRIDELKEKEKEAYAKFMELKNQFNEINRQLKEKLPELNALREEIEKHKIKVRTDRKEKERLTLEEKRDIAQTKLKTGQKLTTEDLLALQGDFLDEDK
ncbi:MAG: hypothetical protein QXK37_05665 [Candidatus Woesearchaeota archaeon]